MAKKEGMNKLGAVRAIMQSVGTDAKADMVKDQLKSEYKITDIGESTLNNYMSKVRKEMKGGGAAAPAKATKSQQMAAGLSGRRTDFPHGANAPKDDGKPTLEEVSKIKKIIDEMGLDRLRSALKVAEEIA